MSRRLALAVMPLALVGLMLPGHAAGSAAGGRQPSRLRHPGSHPVPVAQSHALTQQQPGPSAGPTGSAAPPPSPGASPTGSPTPDPSANPGKSPKGRKASSVKATAGAGLDAWPAGRPHRAVDPAQAAGGWPASLATRLPCRNPGQGVLTCPFTSD